MKNHVFRVFMTLNLALMAFILHPKEHDWVSMDLEVKSVEVSNGAMDIDDQDQDDLVDDGVSQSNHTYTYQLKSFEQSSKSTLGLLDLSIDSMIHGPPFFNTKQNTL